MSASSPVERSRSSSVERSRSSSVERSRSDRRDHDGRRSRSSSVERSRSDRRDHDGRRSRSSSVERSRGDRRDHDGRRSRQIIRFVCIGAAGTIAYLALYALLREAVPAHPANVVARVAVAIPTTWLNARLTFATTVSASRVVTGAIGLLVMSTAISAVVLAVEQVVAGPNDRHAELVALGLANLLAAGARFLSLQRWLAPTTPRAGADVHAA